MSTKAKKATVKKPVKKVTTKRSSKKIDDFHKTGEIKYKATDVKQEEEKPGQAATEKIADRIVEAYTDLKNYDKVKLGVDPTLILNIRNISRSEKKVILFSDSYDGKEVIITPGYSDFNYQEIKDLVKVGLFKVGGIFLEQISGEPHATFRNLKMRYNHKNIIGELNSFPILTFVDPHQFSGNNIYNYIFKNVLLKAAASIELYLQSMDEIQLSFVMEHCTDNIL